MEIKASDVKALREKTGAGMLECKKALEKCAGNAEEAAKYLKEKGLAAVEKRADRTTGEGIIVINSTTDKAVMLELTCETDFVAKNSDFIRVGNEIAEEALTKNITEISSSLQDKVTDLATRVRENMNLSRLLFVKAESNEYIANYVHSDKKTGVIVVLKSDNFSIFSKEEVKAFAYDCCLHAAAFTPLYADRSEVSADYIEEQTHIFTTQVENSGKPKNVIENIVKGKVNKHMAEICFLDQPFVKDDKVSVEKKMQEIGKTAGGALSLSKLIIWQLGVVKK